MAIAVAYIGGWLFVSVCVVAASIILWEWTSLVFRGTDMRVLGPGLVAILLAAALTGQGQAGAAISAIAIGAVLAGGVVAAWPRRDPGSNPNGWAAGGVVYAGVALLAPAWLRTDAQLGFVALVFLFAIVWATDIFAYLVGRLVGGPLLCAAVSPKKTWAGAFGGLAGGVAAGTAVAYASVGLAPAAAGALALVLSIVAQGGDLLESAIKRRFGAKDASGLIPGHGGVMDRLDGFLVAALVAVLIGSLHQGMAAPARGLLIW
jgi:phosphatidate cytidylyltransferase